jgi:hypothetical protein
MKKSVYKSGALLLLAFLLVPTVIFAEEVTKEFHKEYNAGANTTLNIENKFGDVVIQTWDKDQIMIDVKITVNHPSQEKAQKYLDQIDVSFSENGALVSAKTVIDNNFSFSGWGGDSKKFRIDYDIKMPASSALALVNKYGNTDIDELHGQVVLDVKYGDINAGKLTRGNVKPLNSISLAYGKASIDEAGWLDMNLRYVGNFTIDKAQALLIDSKYSKLELGEVSSIVADSKYDNLKIDKINNLVLENAYTNVKISELTKKLTYSGSYGSFEIETIPAGFESLETDTRYLGVRLGIDEEASYNLEAKLSYGSLKYNEDKFKNQKRIIESNTTEIAGTIGDNSNPEAKVKVSSAYGTVKLY